MKRLTGYLQQQLTSLRGGRLRKGLKRRLHQLSREGMIGLGLIMLSLGFYLAALQPAQSQLSQLQDDLLSQQEKIRSAAKSLQATQDPPAEQLLAYYKFFPAQTTAPLWLEKIYQAARQQGIQLEQGDYQPVREKSARLLHYQITLPVKGSYLQLRKFLAAVLTEVPIASLDNISFERQKIGDQAIEAKIKLTLYLDQQT
jgi:Tfp pilus assembly protein PilO